MDLGVPAPVGWRNHWWAPHGGAARAPHRAPIGHTDRDRGGTETHASKFILFYFIIIPGLLPSGCMENLRAKYEAAESRGRLCCTHNVLHDKLFWQKCYVFFV